MPSTRGLLSVLPFWCPGGCWGIVTCCAWASRGLCAQEAALKLPGVQMATGLSDCDLNQVDTMHRDLYCSLNFSSRWTLQCSVEENPFIFERQGSSARAGVSKTVCGPGDLWAQWNQGLGWDKFLNALIAWREWTRSVHSFMINNKPSVAKHIFNQHK